MSAFERINTLKMENDFTPTIRVELSFDPNGNSTCLLHTEDLPFEVVMAQMKQLVKALQWQIDNVELCPFHQEKRPE
jgi:hypothetical protein